MLKATLKSSDPAGANTRFDRLFASEGDLVLKQLVACEPALELAEVLHDPTDEVVEQARARVGLTLRPVSVA